MELQLKGKSKNIVGNIVRVEMDRQITRLGLTKEEELSLRHSNFGCWRLSVDIN